VIQRKDVEPWITILKLEGHIVQEEYDRLQAVFRRLESEGRWRVLLDLSRVGFLGRPCIILLLRQNRKALAHGGAVKLLRLNEVGRASFVSAQVSHLFESFRHESDAVKSFGPVPKVAEVSPPSAIWENVGELRRQALVQEHTISMLIAMLEEKKLLGPGEIDARCALAAERIMLSLRDRLMRSAEDQ